MTWRAISGRPYGGGDTGDGHQWVEAAPCRAVQVEPMKPMLKAPGKRLKLTYDKLLSSFAFKFNLRRYNPAADRPLLDLDIALLLVPATLGRAVQVDTIKPRVESKAPWVSALETRI